MYHKFSEIKTTLGLWATITILQNNKWEVGATLDLSPVANLQNMDFAVNLSDITSRYFQKTQATHDSYWEFAVVLWEGEQSVTRL